LRMIDPPGTPIHPIPLMKMHDRPPYDESRTGFRIDPQPGSEYVDVVSYSPVHPEHGVDQIALAYAIEGQPNTLQDGRYVIELSATGEHVSGVTERFVFWVGSAGAFTFERYLEPAPGGL